MTNPSEELVCRLSSGARVWNDWQRGTVLYPVDLRTLFPGLRLNLGPQALELFNFGGPLLLDGMTVPDGFSFQPISFLEAVFRTHPNRAPTDHAVTQSGHTIKLKADIPAH